MTDPIDNALTLIAAIKSVPRWQREGEARLARRMADLFDNSAAAALRELAKRGLPSNATGRAIILSPIRDAEQLLLGLAGDEAEIAAQTAQRVALDALRKQGVAIGDVPPLAQSVRDAIRDKVFAASGRTLERVRGDVMTALSEAYEDGLGIEDAAKRIAEKFVSIRDFELERIARTEIHGAQSDATHATMQDLGIQYTQWITADDDRVRGNDPDDEADHVALHDIIVPVGEPFPNGLLYPGDRNGPIGEWINCRCREVPFIMPPGAIAPPGKGAFYPGEILT